MATGVGRFDAVLAAQASESSVGNAQGAAGLLVVGVDPSDALDALAVDLFHVILPWMHLAANSYCRQAGLVFAGGLYLPDLFFGRAEQKKSCVPLGNLQL